MPLNLTPDDWAEIYYALETKKAQVESGFYEDPEADKKWAARLGEIIAKIGPDGEDAASNGVAPLGQTT
jgi:hypothetical protein